MCVCVCVCVRVCVCVCVCVCVYVFTYEISIFFMSVVYTYVCAAGRSSKTRQSALALSSSSHRSSAAATAMDDATMQDQLTWSRNNMRPSAKTATVTTMATLPSSSIAQYGIAEREKSSSGIVSTSTSSEFQDANENSGFAAILRPSTTLYAGNRQSFSPAADSMPVGSKAREHLSPRVPASLSHQPPNLATDHSRYASQPAVIAGQDSNLQHHDSEVVAVAMQGWHDGQQQEDETSTRHPVSHHSFQLDDGTLTEDDLTDDVVLRDGYSAGDDAPLDVSLLDTLATKKQELLQQKKSEKHKSQANVSNLNVIGLCCLPACLPACLLACLPACLSTHLPARLPAPACLPDCLPACLLVCLSACLPTYLLACLPACLPAHPPARPPACLPLPAYLPACLVCCCCGYQVSCDVLDFLSRWRAVCLWVVFKKKFKSLLPQDSCRSL